MASRQYTIVLRALDGDVPSAVRLRMLLKTALRGFGFRCLDVRELPQESHQTPQDEAAGTEAIEEAPEQRDAP